MSDRLPDEVPYLAAISLSVSRFTSSDFFSDNVQMTCGPEGTGRAPASRRLRIGLRLSEEGDVYVIIRFITAEAKPAGGGGYRSSLSQASTASRAAVGVPRWSASTVT